MLVCVAVAATSTHAWRLPIKPPPFLQNQYDQLQKEAQELRDRLEQELQKIRDQLLNAAKTTTVAPVIDETTIAGITDAPEEETTVDATEVPTDATTAAPIDEETTVAVVITTQVK